MKKGNMNLPNTLTMFRFLLVPVFVIVYFSQILHANLWAAGIVFLAYITDVLDGYIARSRNLVTNFGKIMDPAADKLLQMTLLVCLSIKNPLVLPALIFLFVKDLCLAIGAGLLYKKKVVLCANWFGKVASFVTIFALIAIMVYPQMGDGLVKGLVMITVLSNLIAIITYVMSFFDELRKKKSKA